MPVKDLARAKNRLAEALGETGRAEIARALLDDAFALCDSVDFLTWWVVSDDPGVLSEATAHGFNAVADPGAGLNDALQAALAAAIAAGATSATVIPSDVPLAWAGDLRDLVDTGATSDVVVVPARDGGTNGLYLSPADVMEPRFGAFSFKTHLREAERLGIRCTVLSLPRLELDIDTIADVDLYLARPRHAETASARVLSRVRVAAGEEAGSA